MVDELNRQSHIVDEYKKSFGADSTWQPESWWKPARVVGLSFESCKRKLDKDDLASIRELNYLERISFKKTLMNDDGLSHLSGLPRLRRLNLSGTHITNDGLVHLTRLPKLEEVVLWDTAVTDDGALHLQELMPRTRVNHMATWAHKMK